MISHCISHYLLGILVIFHLSNEVYFHKVYFDLKQVELGGNIVNPCQKEGYRCAHRYTDTRNGSSILGYLVELLQKQFSPD